MVLESKYQNKEIHKIVEGTERMFYTFLIIIIFIETIIDEFKHLHGHSREIRKSKISIIVYNIENRLIRNII